MYYSLIDASLNETPYTEFEMKAGELGHRISLPQGRLVGLYGRIYFISVSFTQQILKYHFISIFCWSFSNNLAQQNTTWFMNKTAKAGRRVNRYRVTYELKNCCWFCYMMAQLCDSLWLCISLASASISGLWCFYFCFFFWIKERPETHHRSSSQKHLHHLWRSHNTPH